jgi:hypothetical protein
VINFSRSDDLNQFEKDFDDAVVELKKQGGGKSSNETSEKKVD